MSDLVNAVNATVQLQLVSLNDSAATCSNGAGASQNIMEFTAAVPGLFASRVLSKTVEDLLALRPGCSATTCYITATATVQEVPPSRSQLWLAPFKDINFPNPKLRIEEVKLASPETINITLAADLPAALVLVSETDPLLGHFDDNAFSLNPCERRTITFMSKKGQLSTTDIVSTAFVVESLYDHSSWEAFADPPTAAITVASQVADPS